jgi:hypothetical protein
MLTKENQSYIIPQPYTSDTCGGLEGNNSHVVIGSYSEMGSDNKAVHTYMEAGRLFIRED